MTWHLPGARLTRRAYAAGRRPPMGLMMLGVFVPLLAVMFVAARRQERVNRAMQDIGEGEDAGYVGPQVGGPT